VALSEISRENIPFSNRIGISLVDVLYYDPRFKELQKKMNLDLNYLPVRNPLPSKKTNKLGTVPN
jgi:hypothetical protein